MTKTDEAKNAAAASGANAEQWPGMDSRYRMIVVAALRAKQLQRGARPRIAAEVGRRRNTSIALEEVRQGLVLFTINTETPESREAGNGLKGSK